MRRQKVTQSKLRVLGLVTVEDLAAAEEIALRKGGFNKVFFFGSTQAQPKELALLAAAEQLLLLLVLVPCQAQLAVILS